MKNALLLLTCTVALQLTYAQEINFNTGPAYEDGLSRPWFFNTTLKKGYTINTWKTFSITPVDDYIKLGTRTEIKTELSFEEGKAYIEGFQTVGKSNYVIYSKPDKSRDEITVYLQEISSEMLLLGSPLRIAAFKGASLKDPNSIGASKSTAIVLVKPESQNHFVLIRKNDSQLDMRAFSLDKGELWSKVIPLNDLKNEIYRLRDIKVSENGNVYLMGSYYYLNDKEKFPFVVMYNPTTKQQKIHNMDSGGDEKIGEIGYSLEYMNDGSLMLAGLTNDEKNDVLSYHVSKVNEANFTLEKFASAPLEAAFNKYARKGVFLPKYSGIQNLVSLKNGNTVLSIEINFSKSFETGIGYYSSAAHVIALDKTGAEQWKTTIQKNQLAGDDGIVGSMMLAKGNSVYLFYNDHPDNKNLAPTDEQKERTLRNWYFAIVAIDEAGKAKKINLFNTDKKKASQFDPGSVQKIEKNLYHFTYKADDRYRFATFSLE